MHNGRMYRMILFRLVSMLAVPCLWCSAAIAQQSALPSAPASTEAAQVHTRARFMSVLQEGGSGGKLYVRLKLLPRSKLPFTTQAFRVVDRALLAGIPEGAWVKFTARHIEGENTLTSIHVVDECKRFQPCD